MKIYKLFKRFLIGASIAMLILVTSSTQISHFSLGNSKNAINIENPPSSESVVKKENTKRSSLSIPPQQPNFCTTIPAGVSSHKNAWGLPYDFVVAKPEGNVEGVHISFHGAQQNGTQQMNTSGLNSLTSENYMVIYPSKTSSGVWNVNPTDGSFDDTNFVKSLITSVENDCLSQDGQPLNVSLSGYSMGAMLISSFLCAHPNVEISSVVLVAGVLPPKTGCSIDPSIKIFVQHGLFDPIVSYDGTIPLPWAREITQTPLRNIESPGVNRLHAAQLWVGAKGCTVQVDEKIIENVTYSNGFYHANITLCERTSPTVVMLHLGSDHGWNVTGQTPEWFHDEVVKFIMSEKFTSESNTNMFDLKP